MKQLLSTCGDYHLVGLDKSAFLFSSTSNTVCELMLPADSDKKENSQQQNNSEDLNAIQSVELHSTKSDEYWCAVSRGDKRLAIYQWKATSKDQLEATIVYHAPKRAVHMCFATLTADTLCLVAGDLAGDAYAYSLTEKKSRLLLGHTASMLTGVSVLQNRILTADRDEKVRVSSFPQSYVIEGYLLGHAQYITSMDTVVLQNNGLQLVATCGGDSTIRLWDLETLEQLSETECPKDENESLLIPIKIALNPKGTMVSVTYDQSTRLDVYEIESDSNKTAKLGKILHGTTCETFPLSVLFMDSGMLLTLQKEPNYLVAHSVSTDALTPMKDATASICQKASSAKLQLPDHILERDNYGNIKLQKLNETRGPSGEDAPWNRIERVDIAKERQKRHKKRKLEKKKEEKAEKKETAS